MGAAPWRRRYAQRVPDLEPLFRLRLRTPRLELRLGQEDEVRALGELAQRGVHPASEMPFSIPWTDGIGEPSFLDDFVGYHRAQLADWSPADWHLPLLVWHDGELVGEQSVFAGDFAGRHEISTGSWLGIAHQRQGIGTEMRTAVLELGFARLGALSAVSAWLEGNDSSRRVSEKLGYLPTGTITVSPRGVEVVAHENRLERARWRPPVPVEVDVLDVALPLLGAA
jgi:RimJ/RimL family protein N-acetyltransferase